jgi:hypothetical protein
MKLHSQAMACFLLAAAFATPAFAAPDTVPSSDKQTRRAEKKAKRAAKKAKRALEQAAKAKAKKVREFTKTYQVPAEELAKNVSKLQSALPWHDNLEEAKRAATQSNKPILWIQALGDLSGLL